MRKPPKKCRRGHPRTQANTRRQLNKYKRKDGSHALYTTKVCRVCEVKRAQRVAQGRPLKDQRKGRR